MAEITLENKWAMICQHKANQKVKNKFLFHFLNDNHI